MSLVSWSALLFAGKWLLIAMIYFVLFVLLLAVRREMLHTLREGAHRRVPAAGRLRVIQAGSDPRLKPGEVLPLLPDMTFGAIAGNDLVVKDRYISSHHARLRWDGVRWWVEDLNSRNGTFVNGQRIPAEKPQHLPPGARLGMGDAAFELVE